MEDVFPQIEQEVMLVKSQVGQKLMLVNFIGITGCHVGKFKEGQEIMLVNFIGITGCHAGQLTSNTGVHSGQIYRF